MSRDGDAGATADGQQCLPEPSSSVRTQPRELVSTRADREAPAPLFWSKESRSPPDGTPQGRSRAPDAAQADWGRGPGPMA